MYQLMKKVRQTINNPRSFTEAKNEQSLSGTKNFTTLDSYEMSWPEKFLWIRKLFQYTFKSQVKRHIVSNQLQPALQMRPSHMVFGSETG